MYGLLNPLVFNDTTDMTAIPGTTSLFRSAIGPEGLLYKKVASIAEAAKVGGVMLIGGANEWVFYCGRDLEYALKSSKLGKVLALSAATDKGLLTFSSREDWNGERRLERLGDPTKSFTYTTPGGVFQPAFEEVDFLPLTGTAVRVFAIVCSATSGHGYSASKDTVKINAWIAASTNSPYSYMMTEVPFGPTFAEFMRKVRGPAIAAVPDDVKGYYESTLESTLDGFAYSNSKPTIGVSTYWAGQTRWTGGQFEPADWPSTYTAVEPVCVNPPVESAATVTGGWDGRLPNPVFDRAPILIVNGQPGIRYLHASGLPYMVHNTHLSLRKGNFQPAQGVVGGLNVGYLKDLHTLAHSLVDGVRLATLDSSHADLASYVNELVFEDKLATRAPSKMDDAILVESYIGQRTTNFLPTSPDVFSPGTLPGLISAFSKRWDLNAISAAKGA